MANFFHTHRGACGSPSRVRVLPTGALQNRQKLHFLSWRLFFFAVSLNEFHLFSLFCVCVSVGVVLVVASFLSIFSLSLYDELEMNRSVRGGQKKGNPTEAGTAQCRRTNFVPLISEAVL